VNAKECSNSNASYSSNSAYHFCSTPPARALQIKCPLFWSCQDDWTPNDSKNIYLPLEIMMNIINFLTNDISWELWVFRSSADSRNKYPSHKFPQLWLYICSSLFCYVNFGPGWTQWPLSLGKFVQIPCFVNFFLHQSWKNLVIMPLEAGALILSTSITCRYKWEGLWKPSFLGIYEAHNI